MKGPAKVPYANRQEKEPTAQFFAEVVAILKLAYPKIEITADLMSRLKPTFVAAWRRGYNARKAATLTCQPCSSQGLVPSEAFRAETKLPKRAVRPPKGATRGSIFGAKDLRVPAKVGRLLHEIEVQRDAIAEQSDPKKRRPLQQTLVELESRLQEEWPPLMQKLVSPEKPRPKRTRQKKQKQKRASKRKQRAVSPPVDPSPASAPPTPPTPAKKRKEPPTPVPAPPAPSPAPPEPASAPPTPPTTPTKKRKKRLTTEEKDARIVEALKKALL